jgi:adenine-specific DNA-methyltransferase
MRPTVGTQANFRKKVVPKTYRYDASLAPELAWDGQNAARDLTPATVVPVLPILCSLPAVR